MNEFIWGVTWWVSHRCGSPCLVHWVYRCRSTSRSWPPLCCSSWAIWQFWCRRRAARLGTTASACSTTSLRATAAAASLLPTANRCRGAACWTHQHWGTGPDLSFAETRAQLFKCGCMGSTAPVIVASVCPAIAASSSSSSDTASGNISSSINLAVSSATSGGL